MMHGLAGEEQHVEIVELITRHFDGIVLPDKTVYMSTYIGLDHTELLWIHILWQAVAVAMQIDYVAKYHSKSTNYYENL